MQYTNYGDVPLPLAVWLAADRGYDLKYDPYTISATTLQKPVRSVVLSRRIQEKQAHGTIDVSDIVQAKLGTAVHTAIEDAWIYARDLGLQRLGTPQHIIDRIRVNPEVEELSEDILPLFMEVRSTREILGADIGLDRNWKISGKFDMVWLGRVRDTKTTKVYNWIAGSNDENYVLQGSIYRWLNPEIITDDFIDVDMLFTDWSPLKAQVDKSYPPKRIMTKTLPLLSIEETDAYVRSRLLEIARYVDVPEEQLPQCTPQELWMDPPKWAFYKDKTKLARATKLFDNSAEAHAANAAVGGTGLVTKREMEPKFCNYCPGRQACSQAAGYIEAGILKL